MCVCVSVFQDEETKSLREVALCCGERLLIKSHKKIQGVLLCFVTLQLITLVGTQ